MNWLAFALSYAGVASWGLAMASHHRAWVAMLATSGFALTQLLAYAPRFALAPAAALLLPAAWVSFFP